MKKLSQAIALAGVMTAAAVPAVQAEVEVSASAAVANMYLWRGQNLGSSDKDSGNAVPAISGDINVSMSGAYAGVWTSSGDTAAGQEYDLYVGYGAEAGDFSYDLSVWTYIYPDGGKSDGTFGDGTDVILSLGYAGASFTYYKPIGSESDDNSSYYTLGYGIDAVSATLGKADDGDGVDYTHLDLGYAYNDNLSFTLSKVVDQSEKKNTDGAQDEDLKVVVTYSLPIEL